jgi:hypothetical protein
MVPDIVVRAVVGSVGFLRAVNLAAALAVHAYVYPVHTIIRYFLGSMTLKLSVTSSQ